MVNRHCIMKKLISSIGLAALCATHLLAAEWGDPAKPLDIKEWVKGSAVNLADGKGKTIFNLYIMGNNLFDVAYFDHLSRLKYFLYSGSYTDPTHGIHNMGRNIAFKIEFPLNFDLNK